MEFFSISVKHLILWIIRFLLVNWNTYGIRGIARDWVVSCLTNRKQVVFVNGSISDQLNAPCGVPQGSVLGPLLFLVYINDFHNSSKLFDFHLFADDDNLFYKNRNLIELARNVNIELQKVHTWPQNRDHSRNPTYVGTFEVFVPRILLPVFWPPC